MISSGSKAVSSFTRVQDLHPGDLHCAEDSTIRVCCCNVSIEQAAIYTLTLSSSSDERCYVSCWPSDAVISKIA